MAKHRLNFCYITARPPFPRAGKMLWGYGTAGSWEERDRVSLSISATESGAYYMSSLRPNEIRLEKETISSFPLLMSAKVHK